MGGDWLSDPWIPGAAENRMKHDRETKELWLRRQALQVACQLPEGIEDARKVIDYMRELVDGFWGAKASPRRPALHIIEPKRDTT